MNFGDIVYFYNIIFKNEDGTHEIDPGFNTGRPCVYIGEYEGDMYFLPLTRPDYSREEKYFNIIINPSSYNKLKRVSKINYNSIIKKPSSFYKIKGYINKKSQHELLKKALILYSCRSFENIKTALS